SRNRVEDRGARAARDRIKQGGIGSRQHLLRVRCDKAFNLPFEEASFKKRVEDGLLRNELVSNGVPNRLRQACAMTRDHPLRPNGDAQKFLGMVRMKQHPDRQPRGTITMKRCYDDDAEADQNFEGDWTDSCASPVINYDGGLD